MNQFKFLLIFFLSSISISSYSLTIGLAKTTSKYGEPLSVEIELYKLYEINYSDIKYRIVPRKEHGLISTSEALFENSKFGFYASNGIGWVTITSPHNVETSIIDFVIEITWPSGKTKRRYQIPVYGKKIPSPDESRKCEFRGSIKCD